MKTNENNTRKEVTKIDVLDDVIDLVNKFDSARLSGSPDTEKLHKTAVKAIEKANSQYGDGFVSISKVRALQQSINIHNKEVANLRKTRHVQTNRQK